MVHPVQKQVLCTSYLLYLFKPACDLSPHCFFNYLNLTSLWWENCSFCTRENIQWFLDVLHLQIPPLEMSKYLRTRPLVCLPLVCLIYSGMPLSCTFTFLAHILCLLWGMIHYCEHCSNKTEMAMRLFTALRLEDQSLRLTIQEAATSLATAYKVVMERLLKYAVTTYQRRRQTWLWILIHWLSSVIK